jgi:hypothetical protein
MIDYKEIFNAWVTSISPTKQQEELAKKRLSVCLGCDYRKEILNGFEWSAVCGDCGCPLNKKIFSQNFSPCTKNKWETIDAEYLPILKVKKQNTLI